MKSHPQVPVDFFFNDTAPTEIYTLSLHDALPISASSSVAARTRAIAFGSLLAPRGSKRDRKSTRLNSSHTVISYAVFCLKKKKTMIVAGTDSVSTMV